MSTLVHLVSYLHVIANWDGQRDREIAAHGYRMWVLFDGELVENAGRSTGFSRPWSAS